MASVSWKFGNNFENNDKNNLLIGLAAASEENKSLQKKDNTPVQLFSNLALARAKSIFRLYL